MSEIPHFKVTPVHPRDAEPGHTMAVRATGETLPLSEASDYDLAQAVTTPEICAEMRKRFPATETQIMFAAHNAAIPGIKGWAEQSWRRAHADAIKEMCAYIAENTSLIIRTDSNGIGDITMKVNQMTTLWDTVLPGDYCGSASLLHDYLFTGDHGFNDGRKPYTILHLNPGRAWILPKDMAPVIEKFMNDNGFKS